ncbi:hypothetical protein PQX77_001221 [Marasmius sp. AFHP31]|nr:hypothetical protein PQX77_001221 [Marasmius sp. AFHP31]
MPYSFYDVNPYPDNLTFKVGDRRLILSLPFNQYNKTLFGLLFQHFFLSRHRLLYWGYLVHYDHYQDEVYFCKVHFHINLPLAARKYINTIAEGIARVGFLTMKTALIPRAVQAWIDAVAFATEAPAPPTLGYEKLWFFTFTPQMGRWLSCTPLAYSPLDLPSNNPPYEAQAVIDMVAEAIARVGFLHSHTAFLPGAVDAWFDLVIGCMEDPPPSKLEPQRLFFFEYHPLMGRWVTRPFYHYNPVLHEEVYLDKLNRAESPSVWDYQREDSELDNYFGWDKVAINNMWE